MSGEGTAVPLVEVRREGDVAVVTLQRSEKLNALSSALERELAAALSSEETKTSKAVVITGGPRVFSAGADIAEMRASDASGALGYYDATGSVYETVAGLRQPSVSAIAGYCLGGGLELALATDFRVAERTAVFGFPEIDIGIIPSSGGTHRLVRLAGPAAARELILLRRRISAAEAHEAGLLTEVTEAGGALRRALELAGALSALPPLAVTVAKRAIDAATESSRAAALLIEQLGYATLVQDAPARERMGSFVSKSPPL